MINYLLRKLIRWLEPLIRKIGKLYAPFSRKRLTHEDWEQFQSILEPGDIVLTHTRGELSNLIIPGFWKHGAIYHVEKTEEMFVEAVGKGVRRADVADFFFDKDFVQILRAKGLSSLKRKKIGARAFEKLGTGYDFQASLDNKTLYCFELVYISHAEALGRPPFDAEKVFGEAAVTGTDFSERPKVYNVVWTSKAAREWLDASSR